MKSFFQNRYVLPDRVIMPDEIEGITVDRRTNEVYFNLVDDEVCELESEIYEDLSTYMWDIPKKEIFEFDRVSFDDNGTLIFGTVRMLCGTWHILWDKMYFRKGRKIDDLYNMAEDIAVTGMISWEDRNKI